MNRYNQMRLLFLVHFLALLLCSSASCEEQSREDPGALWLTGSDTNLSFASEKLAEILERVGPNMRASSDYHDYNDIQLEESILAWQLLRQQVSKFAQQQVKRYGDKLKQLFLDAKVSKSCSDSIEALMESARNLDYWSIQMWSSTGSLPPVAPLDGQFSDLGSYRSCVDLELDPAAPINGTNYCLLPFRPIVPSRPRFHRIIDHVSSDLISEFKNGDYMRKLAEEAQYFHYLYLKTGVCVPDACLAGDMQLVTKLIARRLALMSGPVKCYTRSIQPNDDTDTIDFNCIENRPTQVYIEQKLNRKQIIASLILASFFSIILLGTFLHLIDLYLPLQSPSWRLKSFSIEYFSVITNASVFFNTRIQPAEIKSLHLLRTIIMIWIMILHTMQYNNWSQFTRIFETPKLLKMPIWHAVFNGAPSVDYFFLMSGILASYTSLTQVKSGRKFSLTKSAINRYLRLTPQALMISLFYIIFPALGDSPFWHDVAYYPGRNCERNWWVNLLQLQSFYKKSEICNLVGWWISADMFLYLLALVSIKLLVCGKTRQAFLFSTTFVVGSLAKSAHHHYTEHLYPQNLALTPQVGEVWTGYVNNYFWSPYPHAFAFFLGFWLGYIFAEHKFRKEVVAWYPICKLLFIPCFFLINAIFFMWSFNSITFDNQVISTSYQILSSMTWSIWFAWLVVSSHYDCIPIVNQLSTSGLILLMSKASFIIYLSHMLVLNFFYGSRNTLLEVSTMTAIYLMVGNIIASIIFGFILSISTEVTFMKLQKNIVDWIERLKGSDNRYKSKASPYSDSRNDPGTNGLTN